MSFNNLSKICFTKHASILIKQLNNNKILGSYPFNSKRLYAHGLGPFEKRNKALRALNSGLFAKQINVCRHAIGKAYKSPFCRTPFYLNEKNKHVNKFINSKVYAFFKEKVSLKDKQVVSITYEEIGLFPRSFSRVFDRFLKQLFSDVENLVIQEYRFYRYLFLTTVKCVFILFFVPFVVNFLSKNYLIRPLTEYCWNQKQSEIFLNAYQQKHAFAELHDFEEKIYFESLVIPKTASLNKKDNVIVQGKKKPLKEKTMQLAIDYNNASIEAISCMFADLISFSVFGWLLIFMEVQISVSRLFILEVFFGLDDTKKSLLILLITDLLVGYHSVGPWSILFESLFNRYGLPNSQAAIYLLTGTLPVIMDVFFKYLIFRHLNRASPASVATYHAMIE